MTYPESGNCYQSFLAKKLSTPLCDGLDTIPELHPALFPHQRDVTQFALQTGRAAEFLDTGLGKTLSQLEWSRVVAEHTGGSVLILAPLAVAQQTTREGKRFGIPVTHCRNQSDVRSGVNITNYERLHHFDAPSFSGVVLDESSILKSFMGKTKRLLVDSFRDTHWKLCCTATPAPNDYMEIGNHSEFLGVMPGPEMLSRWFIVDTMEFGSYRLKGHAVGPFWDWVASWARCISRPSDLGYSDAGFELPPLNLRRHEVDVDLIVNRNDLLFRIPEMNATSLHAEKRLTAVPRVQLAAELVLSEPSEPWIVWCDTNYEADLLQSSLPEAIEVRGNHSPDVKEERLVSFSEGNARVLITKPSIAGFGLNWQHCARVIFTGISYSYEAFYQAIRRCWRFGQTRPVDVHVIMGHTEASIWEVLNRKAGAHEDMKREMFEATRRAQSKSHRIKEPYQATHVGRLPEWLS